MVRAEKVKIYQLLEQLCLVHFKCYRSVCYSCYLCWWFRIGFGAWILTNLTFFPSGFWQSIATGIPLQMRVKALNLLLVSLVRKWVCSQDQSGISPLIWTYKSSWRQCYKEVRRNYAWLKVTTLLAEEKKYVYIKCLAGKKYVYI